MVGGEGAKERRRLKRLQTTTGGHEGSTSPATNRSIVRTTTPTMRKSNQRGASKTSFDKPRKKSFGASKGSVVSKKKSVPHKAQTPTKKKSKLLKPKHLKRKLEQTEEEATRERVRHELEEFEAKKAQLSKQITKRLEPKSRTNLVQLDFPRTRQETMIPNRKSPMKEPTTVVDDEERSDTDDSTPILDNNITDAIFGSNKADTSDTPVNYATRSDHDPSSSGSDGTDDSSDDEDDKDAEEQALKRERGRRRRGRKDTATRIEETKVTEDPPIKKQKSENSSSKLETKDLTDSEKKDRYCLGRRPVTDFTIGQKYPGKVVYVKDFGVFFDIGCHSDAFCHVSRLQDDFVANPHELFHEGDPVQARVVEIDRRHKRITVSLQSDERATDERASVEARAERKKIRKQKEAKKRNPIQERKNDSSIVHVDTGNEDGNNARTRIPSGPPMSAKPAQAVSTAPTATKDPNDPAELKRQRKLARRAARRESEGMEES
jgi:predicted RNA-binding protein with RPS1 domain